MVCASDLPGGFRRVLPPGAAGILSRAKERLDVLQVIVPVKAPIETELSRGSLDPFH
jgi:hypothetical protein